MTKTKPSKGELRIKEVIEIATQALVEKGYSEFTFRDIAAKANMQPGNLQYYFATKQELISAILAVEFQRYQSTLQQRFSDTQNTGIEKMRFSIEYLLQDQKIQRSCVIYWELWALSSHDPEAAKIMEKFYHVYLNNVKYLIMEINQKIKPQRAAKLSVLIVSMIEGLSLFRGYNKPEKNYLTDIEKELRLAILKLVE